MQAYVDMHVLFHKWNLCVTKVLHILYENVQIVKIENYKLNEAHLLRLVQIIYWYTGMITLKTLNQK